MDKTDAACDERLPDIDFGTFIMSLATSALMHLGEAQPEDLPGVEGQVDLPQARQTIDIIAMLRDKTRGNLTEDEQRVLDSVIYDLRLRFVNKRKAKGCPDKG